VGTITPFSIQLRLGNEMLPIQPITNMHMLTQELQRAVHAANDMMWSVPTISTFRNFRSIADSDTPSATYSSSLKSNLEAITLSFIYLIKLLFYFIKKKEKYLVYKSKFLGNFSSLIGVKAYYRPKILL
jgi:hypothetical protein